MIRIILGFLILVSSVFADARLYVFVFKDGVPLKDIKVIAGEKEVTTDRYGVAKFSLEQDSYDIGYYKGDELLAVKEVNLLDNQDSQLFLEFKKNKVEVEKDLPLSAYGKDFKQLKIKKQSKDKGTLSGQILETKSKNPVVGAKIYFRGYDEEALSDNKGNFSIKVPVGDYAISIVHPSYVMKIDNDIKIEKNKEVKKTYELFKADISLEEYVVLAPAVEGSLASTFTELKDSNAVVDAISAEQFSKSGDSSAAGALKRVTGVTIVGGKYVYVRGLGERYSTVLLNDLHIPSPEPTKRVVPLDIFPTGVIQSMNIQKNYTVDLPGNFGGGTVVINTKDIPKEDNYVKGSVSIGYNSDVGKNALYSSEASKGIPSSVLKANENFSHIGSDSDASLTTDILNYKNYKIGTKKVENDKSASLSFGQSFKTSNGLRYGFVGSLYYKDETDTKSMSKYALEDYKGKAIKVYGGEYDSASYTNKYGGLVGAILDNEDGHQVKFTSLYLNETESTFSYGDYFTKNENYVHRYYSAQVNRILNMNQLEGEHQINDSLLLNWNYEKGSALRESPGETTYWYYKRNDTYNLKTENPFRYLSSELEDNVSNYRVDLKYNFENKNNFLKFGINNYNKDRELKARRYRVDYDPKSLLRTNYSQLSNDVNYILTNYSDEFELFDNFVSSDFYNANHKISSKYLSVNYDLIDDLSIMLGVRNENSNQEMQTYLADGAYDVKKVTYDLNSTDNLPAMSFKYNFSKDFILRGGYSKTLSRPDFREFVTSEYVDPVTGDKYLGYGKEFNSDGSIKEEGLTYTTIDNMDLKLEYYLSYNEKVGVAFFQKNFDKPIETVMKTLDTPVYTFRNAKSAVSSGIEFDVRKNLSFLHNSLENYFVSANYSIIDSKITLDKNVDDGTIKSLTTNNRPMQGQSPYVINLQLGYDNLNTRRSAVLTYNEYGERIVALGTEGQYDQYEQPFKKLDFVVKWGLNDSYDTNVKKAAYTLGFKASNLLDSEVVIMQGSGVAKNYKPGQAYSLSLSIKY